MKKLLLIFCILGMREMALAQWTSGPGVTYTMDNVGIGIATPSAKLDVAGTVHALGFIGLKTLSGTSYGRIINRDVANPVNQVGISINGNVNTSNNDLNQDDSSLPTWMALFSADRDDYRIKRAVAGESNPGNMSTLFMINSYGNIGIGSTNPGYTLDINRRGSSSPSIALTGDSGHSGQPTALIFRDGNTTVQDRWTFAIPAGGENNADNGDGSDLLLYRGVNGSNSVAMAWDRMTGNVGIGTTDPQGYKLAVNGSMIAESVKVKLSANWPDYIFNKTYSLKPLSEVEQYIKTNEHLPDIPSAAEIKEKGLDLGEMNAKLLQKIEELTLYLIDQNKDIKDLKASNVQLQSEVNQLKSKP